MNASAKEKKKGGGGDAVVHSSSTRPGQSELSLDHQSVSNLYREYTYLENFTGTEATSSQYSLRSNIRNLKKWELQVLICGGFEI